MATETGEEGTDESDDAGESVDPGETVGGDDPGETVGGDEPGETVGDDDPAETVGDEDSESDSEEAPLTGDPEPEPADDSASDEESEGPFDQFTRSVIVTTCATMLGMVAGIASMLFATTAVGSTAEPDNLLGFAILMGAVFVQFPLYTAIGIETDEFDTKTQLYVFAMTFFMWFITWTVLLTTGGLL